MIYVTADILTQYLPLIEVAIVNKIKDFRNSEYYGSTSCADMFAKIEMTLRDLRYFSNKYIPVGTIIDGEAWPEASNCLTDAEANSLLEEMLGFLEISICNQNEVGSQDSRYWYKSGYKFQNTN